MIILSIVYCLYKNLMFTRNREVFVCLFVLLFFLLAGQKYALSLPPWHPHLSYVLFLKSSIHLSHLWIPLATDKWVCRHSLGVWEGDAKDEGLQMINLQGICLVRNLTPFVSSVLSSFSLTTILQKLVIVCEYRPYVPSQILNECSPCQISVGFSYENATGWLGNQLLMTRSLCHAFCLFVHLSRYSCSLIFSWLQVRKERLREFK